MPAPPPPVGAGSPEAPAHPLRDVVAPWSRRRDRAVIFDFNGTLSDDESILQEIFAEIFAEHLGWTLTRADYFERFAGYSDREIVETALAEHRPADPGLVEDLLADRRDRYRDRVSEHSPIGPGALGLVRRLAADGVPMAIVTGAQRPDVECVLAGCGLDEAFVGIVTEEDVRHGKPHPEGFLRGAELLDVPAGAVLVFEDSVPGVTAARAAGMACVAVASGPGSDRLAGIAAATVPSLDPAILDPG